MLFGPAAVVASRPRVVYALLFITSVRAPTSFVAVTDAGVAAFLSFINCCPVLTKSTAYNFFCSINSGEDCSVRTTNITVCRISLLIISYLCFTGVTKEKAILEIEVSEQWGLGNPWRPPPTPPLLEEKGRNMLESWYYMLLLFSKQPPAVLN